MKPSYIKALETGQLEIKAARAKNIMKHCVLCPRKCGVDRLKGEKGFCNTTEDAVVAAFDPHFGEESPLVGENGSGTIFFSHCNLLCSFCQNFDISHGGRGRTISSEQLAELMLHLQRTGCHNINFVTPSHVVPQILFATKKAAEKGLDIPLVFNTGGYDRVETLRLLDGVVDIYMPDFKFMDPNVSEKLCNAKDYPGVVKKALIEMHRQVKDLTMDDSGIATKGLLIRHLVLPEEQAGSKAVMRFIRNRISSDTYINIMDQYRPLGPAREDQTLNRPITKREYQTAVKYAMDLGLHRLDQRKRVFLFR